MECARCLNDGSVYKISFDDEGVCCYCRSYDEIKARLDDRELMERLFTERLDRVRGRHAYDAAVGISGGKDSVFVLHELIHRYGLHIKAFTMGNGFLTPRARENVDSIVRAFGVEHEYIEYPTEVLKKIYHDTMSRLLTPCIACSYIGYASMIGYAARIDAGVCIHGRTPQQMLRYYGNDIFTGLLDMGLKHPDEIDVAGGYRALLGAVSEKVDDGLYRHIRDIAFPSDGGEDFREFVPYFLYHPYDEGEIVRFLRENTVWSPPEDYEHFDCAVHNAARYIYQVAEGRPHCLPEISALIRFGQLTKEDGRERLRAAALTEKPDGELRTLCSMAGLSRRTLMLKANIYNRFLKK